MSSYLHGCTVLPIMAYAYSTNYGERDRQTDGECEKGTGQRHRVGAGFLGSSDKHLRRLQTFRALPTTTLRRRKCTSGEVMRKASSPQHAHVLAKRYARRLKDELEIPRRPTK